MLLYVSEYNQLPFAVQTCYSAMSVRRIVMELVRPDPTTYYPNICYQCKRQRLPSICILVIAVEQNNIKD